MSGQAAEKRSFLASSRAATRKNPLIHSRWPLFIARAVTLAGFVLTIFAGLFGGDTRIQCSRP